ncbi:MAG TPA: S41 family peptidase [Acidobacteriaceae bacterium]|jgi:carboxyl-terminal processing protease|nr:S41 family peptidase [Acidobacteriaceae bacterium]
MPKAFKLSILAISVVLVVFVFLGGFMPGGVRASTDDNAYRQIEVYSEILQHIQNDYVITPNMHNVSVGSLHGLLEGLDPDSSYLTANEYKAYQTLLNDGKAQVGIDASKRFGYATVVSVVPGSPADKADIKDGDVIEAIAGKSTRVMSLAMIRLLLQGQPGSQTTLSVIRLNSAAPDTITLTRTTTEYPAVDTQEYENSSILYLKPYDLSKDRVDQMIDRLHAMKKNGNQKVLLDLRDVAEGDTDSALRLTNAFMQTGTMATLEGQKYPKQTFTADPKKFITAAPLVVLVNRGTAGPAELVAAALLDSKRADVVGERTFGAGVVQKQIPLPGGDMLFLTVAKYESPSGIVIQEKGVTPNVEVASSGGGFAGAASAVVAPPITSTTNGATATPDDQLNKALILLRQKTA